MFNVMYAYPESGRKAGHVMLDCVAVSDIEDPRWRGNLNSALQGIVGSGAIIVEVQDNGDEINATVNASNVVMPAVVLIDALVRRVTELTGQSKEEVIHDVRTELDVEI